MSINGSPLNEAAALDEEAYQLWLRDPCSAICHLVEIDYRGTSAVYPNWITYTLKLSDQPFAGYLDRVKSIGAFTRQIGDRFTGIVGASIGDVVLDNADGALDLWHNLSIDGQRVRIRQGDPSWDVTRFRLVYECIAQAPQSSAWDALTITLRGIDYKSDLPIQTNLVPDTSGSNAESNTPVPLAFGNVFNTSPVRIDAANEIYQWNDGAVTSVGSVRDSGVLFAVGLYPNNVEILSVNAATDTITTVNAHGFYANTRCFVANIAGHNTFPAPLVSGTYYWVVAAGLTTTAFRLSLTRGGATIDITGTSAGGWMTGYHWTDDLATGKIYLDSTPAGILTLDGVAGSTDAATIVIAALGATNVDTASKIRFQGICSQVVGIYVDERRNRLDVADDIINGLGGWYGYSREGMLQFGRVEGNPASYDLALIEDDLVSVNALHIEKLIPPEKKHRVQYRKNFTNQKNALAAGNVNDIFGDYWRQLYSTDNSVSEPNVIGADEGPAGQEYHALAKIPDELPSLMVSGTAAKTEAARLDAMYYGWGAIFSGEFGRIGTQVDIGKVVKLTHSRFGLSAGVNMTCVYVEDQPTEDKVILKFFVALAAYTPGQL